MNKLIACIMVGNAEDYIKMCLDAIVGQVDKVVICYDSSSKDKTLDVIESFMQKYPDKTELIQRDYEHDLKVKNANSNQRNFYLEHLKKNYMDEWVLCLDADEVVDENVQKIVKYIDEADKEKIVFINPRMVHFIADLAHEDATKDKHYVLRRLFKVSNDLYYPSGEHPVLQTTQHSQESLVSDAFVIFHLAHILQLNYMTKRFKNHMSKSEMHTKRFLHEWYYAHLFGSYPTRILPLNVIPKIIKDNYLIDEDIDYFANRGLESKHIIDAGQWIHHFHPSNVLLIGDGKGVRTTAFRMLGVDAKGFDISNFAVMMNVGNMTTEHYWVDNILRFNTDTKYDLVVVYDVLEHLDETELGIALEGVHETCKRGGHVLISVPVIGDDNLERDPTHKIKWHKHEWIDRLQKEGFEIERTPEHFQYRDQVIICRRI